MSEKFPRKRTCGTQSSSTTSIRNENVHYLNMDRQITENSDHICLWDSSGCSLKEQTPSIHIQKGLFWILKKDGDIVMNT